MIKDVKEVRPELELHPLSNREVFLHADIEVHKSRPNDWPLSWAVTERTWRRIGKRARAEPLHSGIAHRLGILHWTNAVRSAFWRSGTRKIRSVQRERKTSVH